MELSGDGEEYYYYESPSDAADSDAEEQFYAQKYHRDFNTSKTPSGNQTSMANSRSPTASESCEILLDSDNSLIVISSDGESNHDDDDDVYIIDELCLDEKSNTSASTSNTPQPLQSKQENEKSSLENGKSISENCKSKSDNGRNRLENKKSRLENGKSISENGKSRLENGKSISENGKNKTDNVRSRLENKKSRLENGKSAPSPASKTPATKKPQRLSNYYMEESDSDDPSIQQPVNSNFILNTSRCEQGSHSLEAILKEMPDNPKYWTVLPADVFSSSKDKRGRFSHYACPRCREKGHRPRECTNPPWKVICPLCTQEGHTHKNCPSPWCPNCFCLGHTPNLCQYSAGKCSRCDMMGHMNHECPDIYRRFYLTVEPGPIQRGLPAKYSHCYNCGKSGHQGPECKMEFSKRATYPGIISFEDPLDAQMAAEVNELKSFEKQKCVSRSNTQFQSLLDSQIGGKRKCTSNSPMPPKKRRKHHRTASPPSRRISLTTEAPAFPRNGGSSTSRNFLKKKRNLKMKRKSLMFDDISQY